MNFTFAARPAEEPAGAAGAAAPRGRVCRCCCGVALAWGQPGSWLRAACRAVSDRASRLEWAGWGLHG